MAFDPTQRGGENPRFMEHMSPNWQKRGLGIRSPDETAHEALSDRQESRRSLRTGNGHRYIPPTGPIDWAAQERGEMAIRNSAQKGNKGGGTSLHQNMLDR